MFNNTMYTLVGMNVLSPSIIETPFIPPSSISFGIKIEPIANAAIIHPIVIKKMDTHIYLLILPILFHES